MRVCVEGDLEHVVGGSQPLRPAPRLPPGLIPRPFLSLLLHLPPGCPLAEGPGPRASGTFSHPWTTLGPHARKLQGHWLHAWEKSCELVDAFNGVEIPVRADAVVVCAGGFPKDINLYQSSKTMINAYQAVKEGGELYFLSECCEGGGPEAFFGWSRFLPDDLDSALRANFTIAGYIFYVCCEIAAHTELHMLSHLPENVLHDMCIHGHTDPAELRLLDFGDKRVIVMPHGGSTFPMPQNG